MGHINKVTITTLNDNAQLFVAIENTCVHVEFSLKLSFQKCPNDTAQPL